MSESMGVFVICRSMLSVYVSIHLVLPGCLCQVLSAFGVASAEVVFLQEETMPFRSVQADAEGILCHCDEEHSKAADANVDRSHDQAASAFAGAAFSLPSPKPVAANTAGRIRPRGPPALVPWTAAPYSGVFLI